MFIRKISPMLLVVLLLSLPQIGIAQQKHKPKVVLVLSGGGAKGVAHIPLLQVLDSLKIVPDLIIGNSMGSIIGGLYAMGYTGNEIEKITKNIDWSKHLGGSLSMNEVGIEEKNEYDNYLGGLDVRNGKPGAITSILSDQNLREYLTELTYPVYNIKNFDSLPIPFRAMATDIVNGKEVIMGSGNLGVAMRASMSLPAVFKPVPYKGTLLIDGGVLNNFPTDVAQQMGADIIIGSDVGGGMEPKEKLEDFFSVLLQASMLPSNMKNTENQNRCDILVNHLPNLHYATADFQATNEIYKEGQTATKQNIAALAELAEKLKVYGPAPEIEIPKVKNEFVIDTLKFTGVSSGNLALIRERINIKQGEKYTVQELIVAINRGMGTNLFEQITYTQVSKPDNHLDLTLVALEKSPHKANLALHYDSYRGVGAIINYTNRNSIGATSRFLTTLDIAEQPRMRIDYIRYLGRTKKWFWNTEAYGSYLLSDLKENGKIVDQNKNYRFELNNQINKTLIALASYAGFGINYMYLHVLPKNNPELNPSYYEFSGYITNTAEIDAHFVYNTLNRSFYATSGTSIKAVGRYTFNHNITLGRLSNDNTTGELIDTTYIGSGFRYLKFSTSIEKRVPIARKTSLIIGIDAGYSLENAEDVFSENPKMCYTNMSLMNKYALGGLYTVADKDVVPFKGLSEAEIYVTQYTKAGLSTQTKILPNAYLIPHGDVAIVGTHTSFQRYIQNFTDFTYDIYDNKPTLIKFSGGLTASYKTFFGPVNLDFSWINGESKTRIFFSFGYMFSVK